MLCKNIKKHCRQTYYENFELFSPNFQFFSFIFFVEHFFKQFQRFWKQHKIKSYLFLYHLLYFLQIQFFVVILALFPTLMHANAQKNGTLSEFLNKKKNFCFCLHISINLRLDPIRF